MNINQNRLLRTISSGIQSECQTVWIQIRPDVDKSDGSIGGQVNTFHWSSTHYQWRAGIGYLIICVENTVRITCVFNAFLTRIRQVQNVGGRVMPYYVLKNSNFVSVMDADIVLVYFKSVGCVLVRVWFMHPRDWLSRKVNLVKIIWKVELCPKFFGVWSNWLVPCPALKTKITSQWPIIL